MSTLTALALALGVLTLVRWAYVIGYVRGHAAARSSHPTAYGATDHE